MRGYTGYLISPYVSGTDLYARQIKIGGPLPVLPSLQILDGVARCLADLHRAGIVHCDIKPANLIIEHETGRPHLIDYGICTLMDQATIGGPSSMKGTLPWAAPEQVNSGPITPRTDLYGLGGLLYFMCTGKPPFFDTGGNDTADAIRYRPPTPPTRLRAEVPGSVEQLCLDLLEKEPLARPVPPRRSSIASGCRLRSGYRETTLRDAVSPAGRRPNPEPLARDAGPRCPTARGNCVSSKESSQAAATWYRKASQSSAVAGSVSAAGTSRGASSWPTR